METLLSHVRQARRRLAWQQFFTSLPWCLTGMLAAAFIVVSVDKVLPFGLPYWAWLAGAAAAGLVLAILWTLAVASTRLTAAVEIDRRFQLKERVSSALALTEQEQQSPAGQAVLADAIRRIERIELREGFPWQFRRAAFLPLVPTGLAVVVALLVPPLGAEQEAQAREASTQARKQIEETAKEVRKQLLEKRARSKAEELAEAEAWMKRLEQGLKDIEQSPSLKPKEALAKLNALTDQLDQERTKLGAAEKLKQELERLKNPQGGPADKLAEALKQGKFDEAIKALDKLKDEIAKAGTDEEKAELQKQLDQMKDKLKDLADAQQKKNEQQAQDLKQAAGDGQMSPDELARQLNDLAQQSPVDGLQQLAEQLSKVSESLKQGNGQQAQQGLQDLKQQLQNLQQQLDQLKDLDDAKQMIADCKSGICPGGNNPGGQDLQGSMPGQGGAGEKEGNMPGNGLGRGRGVGERPIAEDKTGSLDRHVQVNTKDASSVVTGTAAGPNIRGNIREQIQSSKSEIEAGETDPLTGARLPRNYREHVREYFNKLRDGE